MSIPVVPKKLKRKVPESLIELTKAISTAVPLVAFSDPGAIAYAVSAAMPSLIQAIGSYVGNKEDELSVSAWTIVRTAYSAALIRLFSSDKIERRPEKSELRQILSSMVGRVEAIFTDNPQNITIDCLYSPLKIGAFRDAAKRVPHELKPFSLRNSPAEMRRYFEDCLFSGFQDARNALPEDFTRVELALTGPLSQAVERRRAISAHHQYIIRMFTQNTVFGQEDSGITLSDIYVRQRAIWNTKEHVDTGKPKTISKKRSHTANFFHADVERGESKWRFPLHVSDLHENIHKWLASAVPTDAIRVLGGGPGSGKSTFAKALAVEIIDTDEYDVIFVPLQEIEAAGTFQSRIETLFKNRTELGLDRVDSPLQWLGQRDPDGSAPGKPLLIICDGLDEIAPPGSTEAANVTTDFIQAMGSWIANRNSAGLFVCSIVLGRTISAQEAFRKLGIDHSALIRVGGLLPIDGSEEWRSAVAEKMAVDQGGVASIDQRVVFWNNWCKAAEIEETRLPVALQDTRAGAALKDLTTEPLLLYLLIWTGYLGDQWELASNNRNVVYEEIFRQVYNRKWGIGPRTKFLSSDQGGHVATSQISIDDFFLLQEALGLSSWATGARTVSSEAFASLLKIYLDPDKFDDLSGNLASSLKSVALQSYTRSVGSGDAGFEFVHKTLGEYLISRGIVRWLKKSLERLEDRASDSRCHEASAILSKIIWLGPLTVEIADFLGDEIRLQFPDSNLSRNIVQKQMIPLVGWILKWGLPIQNVFGNSTDSQPPLRLDQLDQRALDVIWSCTQLVSRQAFPWKYLRSEDKERGWNPGVLKISWGSPHGFVNLFSRLSSRAFVGETGRLSTFDYIDISDQGVTDFTFGSVIFTAGDDGSDFRPQRWLRASFRASNLSGTLFYQSNLGSADLTGSLLVRTNLMVANLDSAILDGADLTGAQLSEAKMRSAKLRGAILTEANLVGCNLENSDMSNTILKGAKFGMEVYPNRTTTFPTVLSEVTFNGAKIIDCDFRDSILNSCRFEESTILNCDFSRSTMIDVNWSKADVKGVRINAKDFEKIVAGRNPASEITAVNVKEKRGRKEGELGARPIVIYLKRPKKKK